MTDSLGRHSASDRIPADRLVGASVNADAILEPAWPDPRDGTMLLGSPPPERAPPANVMLPAAPARALHVLPLTGLHWGAATPGKDATPRVRGDHALIHLRAGGLGIGFPGGAGELIGDRLVFVPAGTAFSLRGGTNAQGWLLLIPPALGAGFPDGFRCGQPEAADNALLPALDAANPEPRPMPLAPLRAVLDRLRPLPPATMQPAPDLIRARALAARFLDLLERDLSQDRTMADYARSLGCNLAQLDQACRDSRGRPALDLLYRLLVDRAAALLRGTELPSAQIAMDLGFSSLGHFTRIFGAATGTAPDHFRARAQRE